MTPWNALVRLVGPLLVPLAAPLERWERRREIRAATKELALAARLDAAGRTESAALLRGRHVAGPPPHS